MGLKMIPIYKPYLSKYKQSAKKAIDSEWISNHGIYIELASNKFKEYLGSRYCILMNNGTSATHAMYKALQWRFPSVQKIYVPNYVFIAPWNCALQEYDESMLEILKTDPATMNMDISEEYIRTLDPNSAVVVVHNYGNIVNVPRLKRLRPDIVFLEDNCEGLFGTYEGNYAGTSDASLCSAVSFYGNKTITTGEGGAFLTNDVAVYQYIKTYYSHGMSDRRYIHNIPGTNYRMTNVQAALLYDQMNDIDHILDLKQQLFQTYITLLQKSKFHSKFRFLASEPNTRKSCWMFGFFIKNLEFPTFESYMLERNIQVRPFFYSYQEHSHLTNILCKDVGIDAHTHWGVMLPSYPELTKEEQEYIVHCIDEYLLSKEH